MKYSKFIKDNVGNSVSYLFSFIFTILLSITLCCFSNMKGTQADFNGVSGSLGIAYKIVYLSNFPDDSSDSTQISKYSSSKYFLIATNEFNVPEGYEFVGWNTLQDGTGTSYQPDDFTSVDSSLYLYAQWKLIGDIEEDDSTIDDEPSDSENAETEDKDDVIEDIENPTDDSETGEDNTDDSSGDVDGESNTSGNTGTGSGTSGNGTGSGSSGNSSGGTSSGNSGSTGSSSSSSNASSSNSSNNSNNESVKQENMTTDENNSVEEEVPVIYRFKFMNGNMEFANTSCDVLEDKTCELLLPKNSPTKDGYTFKGWSLSNLCSKNDIITNSIKVNSDNTYYACFEIKVDTEDKGNEWIYLVLSVWAIASVAIYFSIRKFKMEENKEKNN